MLAREPSVSSSLLAVSPNRATMTAKPMSSTFGKFLIWALLAVFISVVSSAVIRYVAYPPSAQEHAWELASKYRAKNDAKFRTLFDDGTRAMKEARYGEALNDFQEAERSTDRLAPDQYAVLKSSREQIASLSESSGRDVDTQGAYKSLAASAIRRGRALSEGSGCDTAVPEFEDAEKFSGRLIENKEESLLESRNELAGCLQQLHRYPEAVQTVQRMIDDLRAISNEYDPALVAQYMSLAYATSQKPDWDATEQALYTASNLCDKTIEHYAHESSTEADQLLYGAIAQKSAALRWLVITYKNEGKTDRALSTADDWFNYNLDTGGRHGVIRLSFNRDIAQLALQMATEAHREDAAELWRQRLASSP